MKDHASISLSSLSNLFFMVKVVVSINPCNYSPWFCHFVSKIPHLKQIGNIIFSLASLLPCFMLMYCYEIWVLSVNFFHHLVPVLEESRLGGQFCSACYKCKFKKLLTIFPGLKCPPCISWRELLLLTGELSEDQRNQREGESAENPRCWISSVPVPSKMRKMDGTSFQFSPTFPLS